jgi:PAS domain S-box-containing protein
MRSSALRQSSTGYLAGMLGVAAVTAILAPFHGILNDTTIALAYLLVVLLVATTWGPWPASMASAIGTLCVDFFFLPPVYTFTIADPQNWVALGAFLVTALAAGQLSELAKRRAAEAEAVRRETRAATAHTRSLLEASLDALVTIGSDGKINDVNTAIETLTGRSRAVLIGSDFSEYFTEPGKAHAIYREVLREGFVRDRRLELRHRDGHVTSILYSASLQHDESGNAIGVVAAARSISTSAGRAPDTLPDPDVVRRLNRFVAFASLFSIAVGVASLIGWTFGIVILKSVIPGQVIIKPNAAAALVLCGASLWLLRSRSAQLPTGPRKLAGQVLAGMVALVGLLSVTEHLAGWDLRIDQALFVDENPFEAFGSVRPGLMAPITALDFLLIGLALLCLDWTVSYRTQRYEPAKGLRPLISPRSPSAGCQYLLPRFARLGPLCGRMQRVKNSRFGPHSGPTSLLAFIANTGAVVGLLDFMLESHTSYTHIALPTAVALFVLSVAVACARTGWGLGGLLASSSLGGVLTRRLWPAAIGLPLLIGAASWTAYTSGLLSEWGGITAMIVSMITLLAGLMVWSGHSLDQRDLARRRAEQSLHRSEEELREAQRLARVGSWWWDPATDTVTWSEGLYRIAGRDPKVPPPGFKEHGALYTPDSFARLTAAVERALQTGASFELELEMVRPDGAIRSVTSHGEAERDAGGRVVLVRGTVHDVTEHKRAEEALRESEASLNKAQAIAHIGSWHLDVARNRLTWSDEVFRIFGVPTGTPLTYDSFLATIHPEDREAVDKAWTAATHGAPYDVEHRILVSGAVKWVRERAEVEFDAGGRALKGVGTVQDITERKHAQQELLRLNRALRALSLCNAALIRASDEAGWLDRICRIIVEEAGYRLCWVGRAEHDDDKTVAVMAHAGADDGYLKTVHVTWTDTDRGRGPVGTCIRTGQAQILTNTATDPLFAPWRREALKRGYGSIIAIPLVVAAEPFGALAIYAAEPDAFHEEEVALLTELASDLAFGIGALRTRAERQKAEQEVRTLNAELEARVRARTADLEAAHDREATIGFRIQQMLLLTQPPSDVPGLQVAALTVPSQRIDGDFYDFFRHENECLDVIVADVMGKGIPAALLAGATKSNFLEALCHLMALSKGGVLPEPKDIVALAHADMVRQLIDLESFVTLSYARLDLKRRVLDLVDCGHTGMLVLRGRTDACEVLHGHSLPLGIREGEIFNQIAVSFEPGDLFLFYSDGITDMRNRAGEWFGLDRLVECVRSHRHLEPESLVDALRKAAVAFAGSDRPTDDLTCVAVKVVEVRQPLAHAELEIRSDLADLRRARAFVRDFCRMVPQGLLDEDEVGGLELAVNEAASNIMKHAYHGRADQRIELEADASPDCVTIRLHHLGDSFDPATVRPPALDGTRESGFGVYLVTRCVDDVRCSRDPRGKNCVALVKMLNPEKERTASCN